MIINMCLIFIVVGDNFMHITKLFNKIRVFHTWLNYNPDEEYMNYLRIEHREEYIRIRTELNQRVLTYGFYFVR